MAVEVSNPSLLCLLSGIGNIVITSSKHMNDQIKSYLQEGNSEL